ncbi:SGNH/GDSL hydrolase family protein [Lysinibacillus sp. 54212]|uniref:SGNH/GDSL hydrolase family protein n=1 Tax=Lysinibacillus sp. 54212 TaxID=3119829 RepID=UPI002FC8A140
MKRISLLLFAFLLFTSSTSAKEVYVALGDSLAAGQTPYSEIDSGYADLIALQLTKYGQLTAYTKELAFPGYAVDDVLERVKSEPAQAVLANATLITVSAGANDLLPLVSYNPKAGSLSYSQMTANFALNKARQDFTELLKVLKEKAPNAQIYVMGYYFPYIHVHETQKAGVADQLQLLNTILKSVAVEAGAQFVEVAQDFDKNSVNYLPNATDIHPNMAGYLVMANAFLNEYAGSATYQMTLAELPKPNPKSFEELLGLQSSNDSGAEAEVVDEVAIAKPLQEYIGLYGYKKWHNLFGKKILS